MRPVNLTITTPDAAGPPRRNRRGVTLVEMLVTVALLVLVMSILVAIFQSATGAVDVQQKFTVIDQDLRRAENTLRSDLRGVTARLTPPLNPAENLGYFTIEENRFADYQGEDIDDVVAFTAKAPPGQSFVGRVWIPRTSFTNNNDITLEPTTVTSDFAEIIYFLRNGNLYRRVLLVKPELRDTLGRVQKANPPGGINPQFRISNTPTDYSATINNAASAAGQTGAFTTTVFGPIGTVSWLGMNDISCRPAPISPSNPWPVPIPNSLGDLTNRENRFSTPRFRNDFWSISSNGYTDFGDGEVDDRNGDGVPDYYPTLHPACFTPRPSYSPLVFEPAGLSPRVSITSRDLHGFPWVFPGRFSYPVPGMDSTASYQYGLIRDGYTTAGQPFYHGTLTLDVNGTQVDLPVYNHNPLEFGESTIPPNQFAAGVQRMPIPSAGQRSTWWGRPTWRETMLAFVPGSGVPWGDPWYGVRVSNTPAQAFHLSWDRLAGGTVEALPLFRELGYPNNPIAGIDYNTDPNLVLPAGAEFVWQDELLLAGVRSFDIKVYDDNAGAYNSASDYYDLGYGSALFPALITGTPPEFFTPLNATPQPHHEPSEPIGFGHEGRIPPRLGTPGNNFLDGDNRVNPAWPFVSGIRNNVGDNVGETIRLARTFDTWSTDYTNAPSLPVDPTIGPYNGFPPTLPSYPAPYPAPLRGIQIQIRAVDPTNQHIRTMTIRQDFANRL